MVVSGAPGRPARPGPSPEVRGSGTDRAEAGRDPVGRSAGDHPDPV
ncbi:MAG: hypothetical protein AVDCRST_MAG49-4520 [uncultured Thermomicrobiales bacterium]|uniref:Uncharacterized protein n=1 Tax=uncultured Thermomicrobiales bacterium TaxID=1645740 RepID=A0A6J4VND8_9BACT|nr:MAG: hypothetical protein AVDCRST_MAG49-4520 [uncultured Thermomicrobiales bacterium]